MNSITTRDLIEADLPTMFEALREMAALEGLSHTFNATLDDYRRTLFEKQTNVGVIVAESEGAFAGFIIYFTDFAGYSGRQGLYIEDIFVKPEFRRRAIGRRLMQAIEGKAREGGYARVRLAAVHTNTEARDFYKALGYTEIPEALLIQKFV